MKARLGWLGVGVALVAGCSDEEWVYRPRRDAAVMDVGTATVDGAVGDRGVTGDVTGDAGTPTGDVGTPSDGGMMGDSGTATGDVGLSSDGGIDRDVGVVATGLVMQAQGIATTSGGSLTMGTLELSETGFEVGQPACVGTLCLAGGLLP